MIAFNFESELTGEIKTLYVSKDTLVEITGTQPLFDLFIEQECSKLPEEEVTESFIEDLGEEYLLLTEDVESKTLNSFIDNLKSLIKDKIDNTSYDTVKDALSEILNEVEL